MKIIEPDHLATVTGGAATVVPQRLDLQTEHALEQLVTDLEELSSAKRQSSSSQLTQLVTVALMSRMAKR